MKVRRELIPYIEEILDELEWAYIKAEKLPMVGIYENQDGKEIIVASGINPSWYKEMCVFFPDPRSAHMNRKHPRTSVIKRDVLRVLKGMVKNKKSKSKYSVHILIEAKRRLRLFDIPWDNQF